jgi:hypothetical protein
MRGAQPSQLDWLGVAGYAVHGHVHQSIQESILGENIHTGHSFKSKLLIFVVYFSIVERKAQMII